MLLQLTLSLRQDARSALDAASREGGYDLVICDPPKHAPTRGTREGVLGAYRLEQSAAYALSTPTSRTRSSVSTSSKVLSSWMSHRTRPSARSARGVIADDAPGAAERRLPRFRRRSRPGAERESFPIVEHHHPAVGALCEAPGIGASFARSRSGETRSGEVVRGFFLKPCGLAGIGPEAMENAFAEVMARRSNSELIEVVTAERDDYQEEALQAAEAEIARRGLSEARVRKLTSVVERARKKRAIKADEPLALVWRIAAFLLPGLINIVIGRSLKEKGNARKYADIRRWTLYGVTFYVSLALIRGLIAELR